MSTLIQFIGDVDLTVQESAAELLALLEQAPRGLVEVTAAGGNRAFISPGTIAYVIEEPTLDPAE